MAPSSRMVTLDSDMFKCCQKVTTLGWSNDAEAKRLLQRAADQVKPIMAKRKWAVPLLTEFYPPMPNLLGLNHAAGAKIEVRLRRPSNQEAFLPYESILGTLLHELVHIEVGPHNEDFYAMLDVLNRECDELMAAGNDGTSGADFAGRGKRLGDWSVKTVPRHRAASAAAAAAMKRNRVQSIMSKGGERLGGLAGVARISDPRVMALAAAERRRADDVWCASARGAEGSSAKSRAGSSGGGGSANDVIVIEDSDEEVRSGKGKQKGKGEVITIDDDDDKNAIVCVDELGQREVFKPIIPGSSLPVRRNPAALAAMRRFGQG